MPRSMSHKDPEARLECATQLILAGERRSAAVKALCARFGIAPQTAQQDYKTARKALLEEGKEFRGHCREVCAAGFLEIYRRAVGADNLDGVGGLLGVGDVNLDEAVHAAAAISGKAPRRGDLAAGVAALRELGKMHGAYEPERIEHTVRQAVLLAPVTLSPAAWAQAALSGGEAVLGQLSASESDRDVIDVDHVEVEYQDADW